MCKLVFKFSSTVLFLCFFAVKAVSQHDSLALTIQEAEKIFLQKNLQLLARQYDVDINKALVQQNRYWDNPVLNTDQNIYDGKFFRHNNDYGQIFVQIQQVIKTAGKRNKLIKLSQDAVLSSEQQLYDLMRNLRFVLHNDFSNIYQLLQVSKIYDSELIALQNLVTGMDAQLQAGNISQKENLRIKSLLYSLQTDRSDLYLQIAEAQKDVHTLLHISSDTLIVPKLNNVGDLSPSLQSVTLAQLMDSSLVNRPDLQLAKTNMLSQQHNLYYQKALAVPDLTAALEFDQRSSYAPNFYGLALSVPIPLLNKNKGNIRAAQISIGQAQNGIQQVQEQINTEVSSAWQKLLISVNLQKIITQDFADKYEELFQNITKSFQQRQVSLIEFIDFFDSYKDARTKQLEQQSHLRDAIAELNFTTCSNIISNP
jgi:cobalt-zinc-cadmium efflux system outer membrane protein